MATLTARRPRRAPVAYDRVAQLEAQVASLTADLAARDESIRRASAVFTAAADGDLEQRVLHIRETGAMGEMLNDLNHLLDMTDAFVREAGATLDHASEEKFYRQVVTRGMRGTFRDGAERLNAATGRAAKAAEQRAVRVAASQEFERSIGGVVERLRGTSGNAQRTASGLTETATGTRHEADVASDAARLVSSSVDTVAAATEEMSASAREIESQAMVSQGVAQQAIAAAEETREVMQTLADASGGINRVVALINEVAGQTRLVALNATIEAAHAGAAGKGFAVVANEVKGLATRTASATEEISERVASIQLSSERAVDSTARIAQSVSAMHEVATSVRQAVAEQRMAIQEISRSMQDASQGTRQVSSAIDATAGRAVETREAANAMVASADDLARATEALTAQIDTFVATVRQG